MSTIKVSNYENYRGNFFSIYAAIVSIFVWLITLIRAANTGITYDEAYTYLYYSNTVTGFCSLDLANNHPINTLLIYLSSHFSGESYNEFIIRLPNILAFGVYLFISYKLSKVQKFSFLTFSLLVLNYYLDEFFGLARGYGISTTFILIAMYIYISNRKSERNLILSLILLTFASATIYSNLVVLVSFSLCIVFFDIGIKNLTKFLKRNFAPLFIIVVIALFLTYCFSIVTDTGKPVFGYNDYNFFKAVPFSFAKMFTFNEIRQLILVLIGIIILASGLITNIKQLGNTPFTILLLVTYLLTFLIAVILKKPLPTDRLLLPNYPILILAICENIVLFINLIKSKVLILFYKTLLGFATLLLIINFCLSINITYTRDWKGNYPIKSIIYRMAISHEQEEETPPMRGNPVVPFYKSQIKERYHINIEELITTNN